MMVVMKTEMLMFY